MALPIKFTNERIYLPLGGMSKLIEINFGLYIPLEEHEIKVSFHNSSIGLSLL